MSINPPAPAGRFVLPPAASGPGADAPHHRRLPLHGFMAAVYRSQDARVLVHTAEQSMARVQAHLARMHALAVEASNSDVAGPARARAQQEINLRVADIDRIARTTVVAGHSLLDGALHRQEGLLDALAGQAGGAALACLPNLRAQSLSALRYAVQSWGLDAAVAAPLPAAAGLTLAVGDQPPVALETLPAAASGGERLAQLCRAINDQTARTGVAAFVLPERRRSGVEGALQLQLLSCRVNADGWAQRVSLGGVVQAMGRPLLHAQRQDHSAGPAPGWVVHMACGLHSISLDDPVRAWVGQLQLEQAAAQLRCARARFAAGSLLGRLGAGASGERQA